MSPDECMTEARIFPRTPFRRAFIDLGASESATKQQIGVSLQFLKHILVLQFQFGSAPELRA
jgi:hypothetical protein